LQPELDDAGRSCLLTSKERVLAVIPCLNEAAHLEAVVRDLLAESDEIDLLVVIADGGSTDGSIAIAKRLAETHPNVEYLINGKRIQSAALNSAIRQFGQDRDFLIRIDAHCRYPNRYCQRLLTAQRNTGAASVVVSMTAEGDACFQRAAAAAQNSVLGNGGSAHRREAGGRYTDHGHHALMELPAFLAVGGYDEQFTHNEDAELDTRLTQAGYNIWLMAQSPIVYYPRKTAQALLRQYINHGAGRARTVLKHKRRLKLRQSLPLAVAPAVLLLPLGLILPLAAVPCAIWAALCLTYGAMLGLRSRDFCRGMSGLAAMIMHLGWSFGFLRVLLRHCILASTTAGE
jgi:succinoglycan biosynthesis protein ExoA